MTTTLAVNAPMRHVVRPLAPARLWAVDKDKAVTACDLCCLNTLCVPYGLDASGRTAFAGLIAQHRKVSGGESLYHAGDAFASLYFVKTGAFKTTVLLDDGREQITGFHFAGDMLGIDAISANAHASNAIALEDARVCALPFAALSRMSRESIPVQDFLHRKLAREVVRDQELLLMLGRMHADERVAAFLRNLSHRFAERGQSPREFTLPMAREDIGNYLGLTLETVSRCFSRLKNNSVIGVEGRRIRILDAAALHGAACKAQAA